MYVNTSAEVKAETDYCLHVLERGAGPSSTVWREHGANAEILFGPDMSLGAFLERTTGRSMHIWNGECHVHARIKPEDIDQKRAEHPSAEFLIHPECAAPAR